MHILPRDMCGSRNTHMYDTTWLRGKNELKIDLPKLNICDKNINKNKPNNIFLQNPISWFKRYYKIIISILKKNEYIIIVKKIGRDRVFKGKNKELGLICTNKGKCLQGTEKHRTSASEIKHEATFVLVLKT